MLDKKKQVSYNKKVIMKDLYISSLLKAYGGLLTDNQRETARLYYDIDLTVTEIAEIEGVTRQSVNDTLNKLRGILENYERQLKLISKRERIVKLIDCAQLRQQIENILEE